MTKVGLPEVTDNKHPQEHDIQLFVCSNPPKGTDCYNFVMIGNTTRDRKIAKLLEDIVVGTKGENEHQGWKVLLSREKFQTWTLENKNVTRLGVEMLWPIGMTSNPNHLLNPTIDEITYTIHYNQSRNCIDGFTGCESTTLHKLGAMQMMVDSAILRYMSEVENKNTSIRTTAKISGKVKAAPHPDDPYWGFDVFNFAGKNTLMIAVSFNFVVQAYQMALEKEHKLPEMLAQMGMLKSAYYSSWFLTHTSTNLIQSLLLIGFGNLFGFDVFVKTDFSVLFCMFFLPTMSFTALAFLIVSLVKNAIVVEAMVSNDPKIRIAVSGLHKVFGSKNGKGGKVAVKSVSFGVNENECMGVLGHNGAGKTTTINMLTGLFSPSGGTANINGYNIKTDFSAIYAEMAVCPQHDILWPTLTAKEHLEFYGQLKGYFRGALRQRVLKALNQVNLMAFANRYSGGFSGGMKRRLSMANALVGDPSVVFMDEPSTGLDPASKHQLWEVISNAKGQNKSMILTTHSMEEADVLCDRIAIMAAGEIQCIGAGYQLKRRFGKGYTFQISSSKDMKAIDDYVHTLFPSARILEDPIGGLAKYEVAREDVVISTVFHELTENKEKCTELGITSWGLTETTLEEVFLKLAALAEIFDETETTKLVTKDKSKSLAEQLMSLDSEAIDVSKGLLNDSNNYQLPPRINNDNDGGKNAYKKYEVEATEKAQGD